MAINFTSGLVKFDDVYFNPEKVRYIKKCDDGSQKGATIFFDQNIVGSGCRTEAGAQLFTKHSVDRVAKGIIDAQNLAKIIDLDA